MKKILALAVVSALIMTPAAQAAGRNNFGGISLLSGTNISVLSGLSVGNGILSGILSGNGNTDASRHTTVIDSSRHNTVVDNSRHNTTAIDGNHNNVVTGTHNRSSQYNKRKWR